MDDNQIWDAAVIFAGLETVGYSRKGCLGIVCRNAEEMGDLFRAILAAEDRNKLKQLPDSNT